MPDNDWPGHLFDNGDEHEPHDADYGLVLPFDSDDREFVRGFQLGMLWQAVRLRRNATVMVYADSAEMIARMREAPDVLVAILVERAGDDWLTVTVAW